MRKVCAAAVLTFLASVAAVAQLPRPTDNGPFSQFATGKFLHTAEFTRTVVVDAGGHGDYATVAAAIAFVNTQTHDTTHRWVILVEHGVYTEAAITVPTFTTLAGSDTGAQNVGTFVDLKAASTVTAGGFVTLSDQSRLANLVISGTSTPSAATWLVALGTGTGTPAAAIEDVQILAGEAAGTFEVNGVRVNVGTLTMDRVKIVWTTGVTGTNGIPVHVTAGASALTMRSCWILPSNVTLPALLQTDGATSVAYVIGSIFGNPLTGIGAATADLKAATSSTIYVTNSAYATVSGTIDPTQSFVHAGKLYVATQTPASAAAACLAGQVAFDSGFVYFCPTANTWVRAALATW